MSPRVELQILSANTEIVINCLELATDGEVRGATLWGSVSDKSVIFLWLD